MDLSEFDDLTCISGHALSDDAVTLMAIVRDEMYFLPAFLEHYRALGIERFVFLDDQSTDGTREFLIDQPDTLVVSSRYRYGDTVSVASAAGGEIRILYVWRALLHQRFAEARWAVQVDADEFVHLPNGRTFRDMFEGLADAPFDLVWGAMIDVYPADFQALVDMKNHQSLDTSLDWFFDGERHVRLEVGKYPKWVHTGARARLYETYGLKRLYDQFGIAPDPKFFRRFWRKYVVNRAQHYNAIWKPVLSRWRQGAYYKSSHRNTLSASHRHLLPIVHYRFAGSLFDKIDLALTERSYSLGSRDHMLMQELLREMQKQNGAFVCRRSKSIAGYDGFRRTGNAFGTWPLQPTLPRDP